MEQRKLYNDVLRGRRSGFRIPAGTRDFLLSKTIETGSGTHPAPNLVDTYLLTYSLTHSLTYLLTSRSTVLLQKPTGFQLVKKFPAFYRTRQFITAVTSARHVSPSRASSIQSTPLHPTSWRSILKLSSRLRLGIPSNLFPSGFPAITLPLLSPIRATCPAHLILLDFITPTPFSE